MCLRTGHLQLSRGRGNGISRDMRRDRSKEAGRGAQRIWMRCLSSSTSHPRGRAYETLIDLLNVLSEDEFVHARHGEGQHATLGRVNQALLDEFVARDG